LFFSKAARLFVNAQSISSCAAISIKLLFLSISLSLSLLFTGTDDSCIGVVILFVSSNVVALSSIEIGYRLDIYIRLDI
jgi:hypothetical protein